MDTRAVQRALEKIREMADAAEQVGERSVEAMLREPQLSEAGKYRLSPLYREHALRMVILYSELGANICEVIRAEAEDDPARGLVDLFHANFAAMRDRSQDSLRRELGDDAKLGS